MRYSKKGWEKRKKDREGYAEFYQKHVKIIKDTKACCEECGTKLRGHVSEVAHILPKNLFKSVATNDDNVIYLCGMYSANECHNKFDDSKLKVFQNMLVFDKISCIFAKLEEVITEKIPYKIYDRYQKSSE